MVVSTVCILLLALAGIDAVPPPPGGYPSWTAYRLPAAKTPVANALCLDGSPPLYYFSPGWGDGADKYQLHMEGESLDPISFGAHQGVVGGAWCGSAEECYGWWGFRSTYADPDTLPWDFQAQTGYFNRSSPLNSMGNWNYVFIRYCDGWSFASNRDLPSTIHVHNSSGDFNVTVHSRGLSVLAAVRTDLLSNRGMSHASDVVVGGCSAGGMAVYLHCDAWATAIAAVSPDTRTVCLADSGWFPLVPDTPPFPSSWFNGVWSGGFVWHNATAALSLECLAAQPNTSSAWLCNMPEVAAPFIHTPLFAYQSRFDSFQIFNMERCIPMPPDPASPCSYAAVTAWGQLLTRNVIAWLDSPRAVAAGSAAFVDSCYHHCGSWADFDQVRSSQVHQAVLSCRPLCVFNLSFWLLAFARTFFHFLSSLSASQDLSHSQAFSLCLH